MMPLPVIEAPGSMRLSLKVPPGWYDLHLHTRWSRDSPSRPASIVKWAKRRDLAGLAVTDHGETLGYVDVRRAAERFGLVVIPGEEIKTSRGELIGLNLSDWVRQNRDPLETVDEIVEQGGLVTVPHPGDWTRKNAMGEATVREVSSKVHALEAANSRSPVESNRRAQRLAVELGLPWTAGSDAHLALEVGRSAVLIGEGGRVLAVRMPRLSGALLAPISHAVKLMKHRLARLPDFVHDASKAFPSGVSAALATPPGWEVWLVSGGRAYMVEAHGGRAHILREASLEELEDPVALWTSGASAGWRRLTLRGWPGDSGLAVVDCHESRVTHLVVSRGSEVVPLPTRGLRPA